MRRLIAATLATVLFMSLVSAVQANNSYTGVEVPGPVGPDLSTPDQSGPVRPYRVTGPGAGTARGHSAGGISPEVYETWVKYYYFDGKDPNTERWVYWKTVVGGYCDPSMQSNCNISYNESHSTSGSWTTNFGFDVNTVKVNTGFNIGNQVSRSAGASGSVTPGYTGYIDFYDVYYDTNWWGHTDWYVRDCDDSGCYYEWFHHRESGGGSAKGTAFLGYHVYQRFGPPF